jgi:phosphatidylglycerophosphate synthase
MEKIYLEFILFWNSLTNNNQVQIELNLSTSIVLLVLYITYIGIKKSSIKGFFSIHNYEKEPQNLKESFFLYVNAPIMSANGISMWRIYLSLPLVIATAYWYKDTDINFIFLIIYVFLFVTDALDGAVSKHLKNITNIGKILDPLADKVLDLPILLLVSYYSNSDYIFTASIIIAIVDIIGQNLRKNTANPAAGKVGKLKTVLKIITIYILGLNRYDIFLEEITIILITISLILTIGSALLKTNFFNKFSLSNVT